MESTRTRPSSVLNFNSRIMSWRLKRAPQLSCTKKKRSREFEVKSEPPFKISSGPEIVPHPGLDTVHDNQDSKQETPKLPTPDQIDPSPAIWEPDSPTFDLSTSAHSAPLHPGFANYQNCGDKCCASRRCRIAPNQVAPSGIPTLLQLCICQLSREGFVGGVALLPIELAVQVLCRAVPLMSSLPRLTSYLHPDLQSLDLTLLPRSIPLQHALLAASLHCPLLLSLSLPPHTCDAHLSTLPSRAGGAPFPTLTSLHLQACLQLTGEGLTALTRGIRGGVAGMGVGGRSRWEVGKAGALEGGGGGLVVLVLRGCVGMSDFGVRGVVEEHGGSLREVCLSGCTRITDQVTEWLPPGITRLHLAGLWRLTDTSLRNLRQNCPSLHQLDLSGSVLATSAFSSFSSFALVRLGEVQRLEELRLACQDISAVVLQKLQAALPGLKIKRT